jgi:hypothetical protein
MNGEITSEPNSVVNFWENCNQRTKPEIIDLLVDRLGKPKNELDINCLNELASKIIYFYGEEKDFRSKAVSSLIGQVAEITQKEFKEGKRKGQIYYSLKLTNKTILRVIKEDLPAEKWTQVEKLAILDQILVFKYRKWIIHKDICDFYPVESEQSPQSQAPLSGANQMGENQVN